jgi:hypothetical protein
MNPEDVMEVLTLTAWEGPVDAETQARAVNALEDGRVVFLPNLAFQVAPEEQRFLRPDVAGGDRKNVSFDHTSGKLGGSGLTGPDGEALGAMIDRFGRQATALVGGLVPRYAPHLERARTSYRPVEVKGRPQSVRHDDRLLHVDAFPTRPMRGRRILRLFTNIAPDGTPREWKVGEPFAAYAARFLPKLKSPVPGAAFMMKTLGLTKGTRSAYDSIMLGLHDAGKYDTGWQTNSPSVEVDFPPGSTWMCYTDSVLHAALGGHMALEQTFHLPIEAMARPDITPLRMLEKMSGRALI